MSLSKYTFVFGYGSLKLGHGNNALLRESTFVGNATTCDCFDMWGFGFPFCSPNPKGYPVLGEVYEVDEVVLGRLDRLEGHPNWYRRHEVSVEVETGEYMTVWMYLMKEDSTSTKIKPNEKGVLEWSLR